MELTVRKELGGHVFELTMRSDVEADLSAQEVESRIAAVMSREVQRFAEISIVGLQDKEAAVFEAARIRGMKERGPAQLLAAGTKDPAGRLVMEVK